MVVVGNDLMTMTPRAYCDEHFDGNVARMAAAFGFSQSFLRRVMLPVGHAQRRGLGERTVHRLYVKSGGTIQPNDLFHPLPALPASTSAKRRRRDGSIPPTPNPSRVTAPTSASTSTSSPTRTRGGTNGKGKHRR